MTTKTSEPPIGERSVVSPSADKIKKRLTNKALHYLGRYATTSARLDVVLRKFAGRKVGTGRSHSAGPGHQRCDRKLYPAGLY